MIHTIIQIFVMALLFYVIHRESKRDRLADTRKKQDLHDLFQHQRQAFKSELESVVWSVKAQIELSYPKRLDELLKSIQRTETEMMANYNDLRDKLDAFHQVGIDLLRDKVKAIQHDLYSINSKLEESSRLITVRLTSLETPVKLWGEAVTANVIKEGESNRTLRRRLQETSAALVAARQSLKCRAAQIADHERSAYSLKAELEQAKAAARDIVAESMKEISLIRGWMEERGIPCAPLDKHLTREFKGNVPSQVYSRAKDEQALQETLSN